MLPFQKAVAEGIGLLMTAHVLYPAFDPDLPATLSPKILTGLLREELGFKGLIISDDLFMKGIAGQWGLEEAAERFLRAGGDLVLLCHEESAQRRVAAHLVHLAERDAEFRDLIEAKAKRLESFRAALVHGIQEELRAQVGSTLHRGLAEKFS